MGVLQNSPYQGSPDRAFIVCGKISVQGCYGSGGGAEDGTDLVTREETLPRAAQSNLPGNALGAGLGRGCAGCLTLTFHCCLYPCR